ncbi:MAG: hypothetical protein K1X67_26970 [Fimbriimonadaceae bacterium]|nr:hypothetical protein [Fimbriimonadaceae bacterium]
MTSIVLIESTLAALKKALRARFPAVKSSHLAESVAHALGYRTHAALLSARAKPDRARPIVTLSVQRLNERLQALGYPVDFNFDLEQLCGTIPGLLSTIPNDSQVERYRCFEQLIRDVLDDHRTSSGEGFNFADVEWVAAEAKAQGLLSTREDADLLVEAVVKLTSVSERVCLEEILPALQYRPALDTKSSRRLDELIREQGWGTVAHLIGISKSTLEKLVSGGSRGPFFRHQPAQNSAVEKARAFLASGARKAGAGATATEGVLNEEDAAIERERIAFERFQKAIGAVNRQFFPYGNGQPRIESLDESEAAEKEWRLAKENVERLVNRIRSGG